MLFWVAGAAVLVSFLLAAASNCQEGHFMGEDKECLPCAPGTFKSTRFVGGCAVCPANTRCPDPGTVTPLDCAAGRAAEPGSTRCTLCPIGSVVTSLGHCVVCPTNSTNAHPGDPCRCIKGHTPPTGYTTASAKGCVPCPIGRCGWPHGFSLLPLWVEVGPLMVVLGVGMAL